MPALSGESELESDPEWRQIELWSDRVTTKTATMGSTRIGYSRSKSLSRLMTEEERHARLTDYSWCSSAPTHHDVFDADMRCDIWKRLRGLTDLMFYTEMYKQNSFVHLGLFLYPCAGLSPNLNSRQPRVRRSFHTHKTRLAHSWAGVSGVMVGNYAWRQVISDCMVCLRSLIFKFQGQRLMCANWIYKGK